MPAVSAVWGAIVVASLVAAAAIVTIAVLRRRRAVSASAATPVQAVAHLEATSSGPTRRARSHGELVAFTTGDPQLVVAFGPSREVDSLGTMVGAVPAQMGQHAAALSGISDVTRAVLGGQGRLVLVDAQTAAAIRGGRVLRDGAGQILGLTRDTSGKISHVARITQVGGAVASVGALAGAASAMATQAQLARIEASLTTISNQLARAEARTQVDDHADRVALQQSLVEVYETATQTGELTVANWNQVAGLGKAIRMRIQQDEAAIAVAIAELEDAARKRRTTERLDALIAPPGASGPSVGGVQRAVENLTASRRAWTQYSLLRLWHLFVIADPTAAAYEERLRAELGGDVDLSALQARASAAVDALERGRWAVGPAQRRMTLEAARARARIEMFAWSDIVPDPVAGEPLLLAASDGDVFEVR